jgi:chemotaxis protein MotB
MARREKKAPQVEKASQEWLVTFGDLLTLLITFFVLLISMSSMDQLKLRKTFGFFGGASAALERGKKQAKAGGAQANPQVKATRAMKENLGVSPGSLTGSLIKQIERIRLHAAKMMEQLRLRNANQGYGMHPLDKKVVDLLEKNQPVIITQKRKRVEVDFHLGLLFDEGKPDLKAGSGELLAQVKKMVRSGVGLGSVQTAPAERGYSAQFYSPWDLAIWRSAALIRYLRSSKRPSARVAVAKDPNYIKLVFRL